MTGLDLETFLHLLRADLGAWATLGVAGVGLALLVWSSWRSRRVLRRCLVLSLAAHLGLVMYGSTVPAVRKAIRGGTADPTDREHIRQIRVAPLVESGATTATAGRAEGANVSSEEPRLELAASAPTLADPQLRVARPPVADGQATATAPGPLPGPPVAVATVTPRPRPLRPRTPGGGPPARVRPGRRRAPAGSRGPGSARPDRTGSDDGCALPPRPPIGPIGRFLPTAMG